MPVESNHQSTFQQNGQHSHLGAIFPNTVNPVYPQDELNLNRMVQIARRRRWLIAGVAIAVTTVSWGWTLTRTPIYQGEFHVLVESADTQVDPSQNLVQGDPIQSISNFDYDTQIEVLRSPALLQPILQNLQTTYPELNYGRLASGLFISRLRETKVLTVSYLDPDPQKIEAVLDEIADQYLSYSFQQRQTSLRQGVQFVDEQLPELRERVNTLQVKLERFRQRYSLIDPESRGDDLSTLISNVEEQHQQTQTELSEARSLYITLSNELGYSPSEALAASALSESPGYQSILNEIREVETELAQESARFKTNDPHILALEDRRASLLPLLNREAERLLGERFSSGVNDRLTPTTLELGRQLVSAANQVKVLESRRAALEDVEAQLKEEFALVPALARQYTDLQRELNIATESLNRFLATREVLQIEAAQKSIPWELISSPVVPRSPISPKVPRNLTLGAIAGIFLGAAAAFISERLDTAFHSPSELKAVTKLPLLGVIPFAKELHGTSAATELTNLMPSDYPLSLEDVENWEAQSGMITAQQSSYKTSPFFEAFRSFYANIRFLSSDAPIRSLVISSAAPAEGKSTTALHLAKAAAAMGQRVLLVDADLRCPQIHTRLGLSNLRGLSTALTSTLPLKQVIQRPDITPLGGSAPDRNLFVLPAGPIPPDPIKLLSSKKMQALMAQLQSQFDLIVYDLPPLIGFADSTLVATHTDGMVLVVGLGKTDRSALTQSLEALKISPVSVLGIVANGIRAHTTHAYGYYRYHRYYSQQPLSPLNKFVRFFQNGKGD